MSFWGIFAVIAGIILAIFLMVLTIEKSYLRQIGSSSDVSGLLQIADSGETEKRKAAAEKRLLELVRETTDPDDFVRIALKYNNPGSFHVNIAERFSPEELLLEIRPRMYIPDPVCEAALEQINDENTLAEAYEKMDYSIEIRGKVLEKITDRDLIYSLAVNHPDREDVVSRLDAEQLRTFGMDCCKHGHHDWEIKTEDTTNEELDIRSYYQVRRCRRCGRTITKDYDAVYGTEEEVTDPGLFNI